MTLFDSHESDNEQKLASELCFTHFLSWGDTNYGKYVVMPTGQDGIQEQRINIGLKVPAVHLDAELIPQHQRYSECIMRIVISHSHQRNS